MRHFSWDIRPNDFTWNVYIDYDSTLTRAEVRQEIAEQYINRYCTGQKPADMDQETWNDFQEAGIRYFYSTDVEEGGEIFPAYILTNHPIPNDETARIISDLYDEEGGLYIASFQNSAVLHALRGTRESSLKLSWDLDVPLRTVPLTISYPNTEYVTEYVKLYRTNWIEVDVPYRLLIGEGAKGRVMNWIQENKDDIDWFDVVDAETTDTDYLDSEYGDSSPPEYEDADVDDDDLTKAIEKARRISSSLVGYRRQGLRKHSWDLPIAPRGETPGQDLEPMSDEEYAFEHGGLRCPFCRSGNISAGEWNPPYQTVTCENCDERWYDVYKLTGYEL